MKITKISAKKVVIAYAEVIYNGGEYRVWPDGQVDKWKDYGDCWEWCQYPNWEDGHAEIKAAGLKCHEETPA